MRRNWNVLWIAAAFLLFSSSAVFAQCYLDDGCQPVDNLTYMPNGTGQVYHGDGASNNGLGGWTTAYADVNQCTRCHYGSTYGPYLMTGHRNTLRKFAPGGLWGGPDGMLYPTNDPYYGSGSTYNWTLGQVTLGWCLPTAVNAQNGLAPPDPFCKYPYYTLPNANAPTPYTVVPATPSGGGVRNLFYLYGGWMNYGGTANPAATHLNTVFDTGLAGDAYPNGNFDCARCHATGYNFDNSGPEPTANTNSELLLITNAQLGRVPTDGYAAPGTNGTSSWFLTGIQCERCHVAAYVWGSHPQDNVTVTVANNEASTALCMECHRTETITPANPTANPPTPGNISPANALTARDHGYCSDLSGSTYATCVANSSNQWIYKPYIDHEAGQAFLNGPHARFTGTLVQNAQHSSDLSITLNGTYASAFSENASDPTKNLGCTGCHDPHQSTVGAVHAAKPIVTPCDSCHKLAQNILSSINHPVGPGTPFPTGTAADIPGACITCHMQGGLGRASSHLFRINANSSYRTFPTPAQMYTQGITALATAPEFSPINGTTFNNAAWLDVDLACGQCHVGNDAVTNEYGLTYPPGLPGAHAFTKAQLAYVAANMHASDPAVPTPTFSPMPNTYHSPQAVTISDAQPGATIYYTLDGTLPTIHSPVYAAPIQLSTTTTINAIATFTGLPQSADAFGTYSILLPTAPAPLFSPVPSTYSSAQSVKLSNTANLPMFYTTDGSTPSTSSIPYTAPINVATNTTIKALTAAYGYLASGISTGVYLIQAPTPTFTPNSGTYSSTQNVTISDTASAATIYYTTNGTAPTTSSTACANPCAVSVSTTTTLKAMASGGGYTNSNIAVATYTIAAATPAFSPNSGTYYTPQTVTITDTTPGVTLYYTTDGSYPTTSGPSCTSPCTLTVATTTTVKAIATGSGISQSGVGYAIYTIAALTPTFSPASGTYTGPLNVTISDATSGVTIYYTTNGSTPTTASTACANPCALALASSATVKAVAAGTGISQSGVGYAIYTVH